MSSKYPIKKTKQEPVIIGAKLLPNAPLANDNKITPDSTTSPPPLGIIPLWHFLPPGQSKIP